METENKKGQLAIEELEQRLELGGWNGNTDPGPTDPGCEGCDVDGPINP